MPGGRTSSRTPRAVRTTFGVTISGRMDHPRKHRGAPRVLSDQDRVRPTCGTEFVASRAFPESDQGHWLLTNVIGFRGIRQFSIEERGSGGAGGEGARPGPLVGSQLPPGAPALRTGRRALHRRLVEPAHRAHAVLAARPASRPRARAHLAADLPGADHRRGAPRRTRCGRHTGPSEEPRGSHPLSRATRPARSDVGSAAPRP